MKLRHLPQILALLLIASASSVVAADAIEDAMKKYHKAPKGTDPTCKKVSNNAASPEELADILKSYQAMCAEEPPKGDKADWVAKCKALIAAVQKIQAKDASGVADYKKAVNCKACHSAHKPD